MTQVLLKLDDRTSRGESGLHLPSARFANARQNDRRQATQVLPLRNP